MQADSFRMALICSSLNRLLRTTPPLTLGGSSKNEKSHFQWTNALGAGQVLFNNGNTCTVLVFVTVG
jgi:hypothetical protein